ncbi:nucleoside phosphorylase domain-containing protein [Truncatella angustata]|uniref:Nucleoside phosphorylase domain-containing protein n=1 Tax=Truncatella angustata TaxID=152316 RepID=A0A9P8RJI5_9PEZI|nr:nucleoside phosphorylase domain-containing protein [Truncatella angustata]KAH6647214.1 nucleoside phosphorylase domain-containing protein [Truncatella angustata]
MGQHNVVIAIMSTIGNNAAAMVITQLLNDFNRIRFGLLVGIGGGIHQENYESGDSSDIRLGDVVVSESLDTFGGVVQFDRGKSTNGGFQRTGHLNKPPHVLASHVQQLKAVHNLYGNGMSRHFDEMLKKYPQMKAKYSYPVSDGDQLFEASYIHEGGKRCKKCDPARIVKREQRINLQPQIHYGTIGSMGILCVEMEAAGLMDAFPCLVIRSISDYADSHKNKIWQPYAAAIAAAYTKDILSQIPPGAIECTHAINELASSAGMM